MTYYSFFNLRFLCILKPFLQLNFTNLTRLFTILLGKIFWEMADTVYCLKNILLNWQKMANKNNIKYAYLKKLGQVGLSCDFSLIRYNNMIRYNNI